MKINNKSLEKLRNLINEETEYRSGPKLVEFFNQFGFNDRYAQGFPSRWIYTDEKLKKLNGTADLDKCIKMLFNPINFISNRSKLIDHINEFNKYLAYDGWQVTLNGKEVSFRRANEDDLKQLYETQPTKNENDFLENNYPEIEFSMLHLKPHIIPILEQRFLEAKLGLKNNMPLSTIFQCGSILEGLFLSLSEQQPKLYNKANAAPKDKSGKVIPFHQWTLSSFIDTSYEIGYINRDVREFSHVLRNYRNYIHPYQQQQSQFHPDTHTAKICMQVLNAAFAQVAQFKNK